MVPMVTGIKNSANKKTLVLILLSAPNMEAKKTNIPNQNRVCNSIFLSIAFINLKHHALLTNNDNVIFEILDEL